MTFRKFTVVCFFAAMPLLAQVTYERILNAGKEPWNWLTYSGSYQSWRYSTLDQINASNAANLTAQWIFQTASLGQFETTPLVVDGIVYGTGQDNRAFALDARTGRAIWRYQRALPEKIQACCGMVNRGFAALGDRLFMATLDAHLIALDRKTGNLVWDVPVADYHSAYVLTMAPLVVKDKIILGTAGGEYGVGGFIDAYSAATGKRIWRFNTVPGPGERGHETWSGDSWKTGGAPAWLTGSYDPELDLLYWPTGNPSPSDYGAERKGDNLYSNSMLALNPDTGKLQWYFQFTPHDLHDYDATQIPVLLDADWQGKPRKLLIQANRNGYLYILDRSNGQFLSGKPFGQITWSTGLDAAGRPIVTPGSEPTMEGTRTCPGALGATNWFSPSYDPQTKLLYVSSSVECDTFSAAPQKYHEGHDFIGSVYGPVKGEKTSGAMRALDPFTGEKKWEFPYASPPWCGALSTAGNVVFGGDSEGNFIAFEAKTGKDLWHIQLGAAIYSSPITYSVDGRQYVMIPAGAGLFAFALPEKKVLQ